ncbi:hypothetical protein RIF29_29143 [Crotalaria pallida]|uniref:CCHC-type domain-containing protein n=1 Tax=Crotalaria pallida TaxID=3830 RepID=A0AAN9EEY3_CROPI
MSESSSVTDHINNLNTLFAQLTASDFTIKENERAELLLQSLPDSYDQLIINITNNNVSNTLFFDDVAGAILEEESRRKNKEDKLGSSSQAEALTMTRGRSMERGSSGSQTHGRSKSQRRKNLKCYNCGKRGHLKKDCWIKKNTEKSPDATTSQGCVASTSDNGEILYSEAAISSKGRKQLPDVWIMDSGATWHMTSRRDWFCTYEPISEGSVFMGNDHALEIVGIGTIKLKMYDGTVRTIQGVRHVKGLKKNLLSIGQLDDLGCKIHIEDDSSEAEPEHEEQEQDDVNDVEVRQSDRLRRKPHWHKDFVMEERLGICSYYKNSVISVYGLFKFEKLIKFHVECKGLSLAQSDGKE